jgi:hypothetical protein
MSTIQITDVVGAIVNLQIRDGSPLAKAKLTHLLSTAKSFIDSFAGPVDQFDIKTVSLGAQLSAPSFLIDGVADLKVWGGINCDFMVVTSVDRLLFPDDGFAPTVPIAANQCWIGFAIDAALGTSLSAAADGFGVMLQGGAKLAFTTYSLLQAAPLPHLKDAFVTALEQFSVADSAVSLRQQIPGTVNICDLNGTVSVTGSYEIPLNLNALASADLPFNFKVSVAPTATAKVSGCLAVTGDFLVRSHKLSDVLLRIGVYKKKGSTFSATLTANAGIEVGSGSTDLLGTVLNAALPGIDVSKCGISADTAKNLNDVIRDSLDRSISIGLNATCTAANTHEAAVLYEIRMDQGDAANTDLALKSALRGDWTPLDSLANARRLRNIIEETKERKHALCLNLLGFYNASSVIDYISKCTILRDETGQLTIVDSEKASRIAATSTPYSADSDKLRTALAQDFITTASYAAVGSKFNASLTIVQGFMDYSRNMSPQRLRNDVLLGSVLGLIPSDAFDAALAKNTPFPHARVSLNLHYDSAAVMSIFFSDTAKCVPRTREELESVGRKAMLGLLDPAETGNAARIRILASDAAWSAMDDDGNPFNFDKIRDLRGLSATELGAVSADWVGITWWANTISKVAPLLACTLTALDGTSAKDPTTDPEFTKEHKKLAAILGAVARETKSAFVNTWGPAVISALSGYRGTAQMDVAWDSNIQHFERKPI